MKRGINGTYVSIEPFHLFRYLDEQSFRYNNRARSLDDAGRFNRVLSQIVGKRLTFAELTGKGLKRLSNPLRLKRGPKSQLAFFPVSFQLADGLSSILLPYVSIPLSKQRELCGERY